MLQIICKYFPLCLLIFIFQRNDFVNIDCTHLHLRLFDLFGFHIDRCMCCRTEKSVPKEQLLQTAPVSVGCRCFGSEQLVSVHHPLPAVQELQLSWLYSYSSCGHDCFVYLCVSLHKNLNSLFKMQSTHFVNINSKFSVCF